jgi:hypothetical protein
MHAKVVRFVGVLLGCGAAAGQTPNPFDGIWRGSFAGSSHSNEIELVIAGTEGSVTRFGQSSAPNNACLNRPLPVVVQQFSAEELVIRIEGTKVLQGCADRVSRLRRIGPATVESDLGATLVLQK